LRKIAVTGSLGAGKTTVCQIVGKLGALVISSDDIVHRLLISDRECIQKIRQLFGAEVIQNHQIDRKKLAELAFADPQKLSTLEHLLHPLVFKCIQEEYKEACKKRKHRWLVVEVPLLFEAGWEAFFDAVIVVASDEKLCQERAVKKGISPADYAARSKRLLPNEEKMRLAHFVVHNNTTREDLEKQVLEIINNIIPKNLDE